MGLDYVYLWHVFEINEEIYRPSQASGDQTKDHNDILRVYTQQLTDMIQTYELPVGYIATGMAVNHDNRLLHLDSCSPVDARSSYTESAPTVRTLLRKSLAGANPPQSKLTGSGDRVTVDAEIIAVDHVWKNADHRPDLKGRLRERQTGTELPFIVDAGVGHPYFEPGDSFRFTDAIDHYYERAEECQLRITERTKITQR